MNSNVSFENYPPTPFYFKSILKIPSFIPIVLGGEVELKLLDRIVEKYGPCFSLQMPIFGSTVIVCSPELAKSVMSCPLGSLISGRGNGVLDFLYGDSSLFLIDGVAHHRLRRLLVPPFKNKESLAKYAKIIQEEAERMVDGLTVNEPFELIVEARSAMLEIILRVIFGLESGQLMDDLRHYLTEILEISVSNETVIRFILKKYNTINNWKKLQTILKDTDRLIYQEIQVRRQDKELADKVDILSLLLQTKTEEGDLLTDKEVRDQLMTLLLAGHETTATTLAWAMERLLRHPDILAKLNHEIQEGKEDKYLDAVVHEVLRLRAPIPAFTREVADKPFKLGKYTLAPGTVIFVHSTYIQHQENLFEDAHLFRPERFIDRKIEAGTWLPFGGGLHSCIGNHFSILEVKICLKVMLQKGVFKASPRSEWRQRKTFLTLPFNNAKMTMIQRRAEVETTLSKPIGCPFHHMA